jgi:hypothetical protein
MARQLRTQLEQEVQFDPLQDPVPKPAPAHTVHAPPPTPDEQPAPEDARAAPAQLAVDVPPVAGTANLDVEPAVELPTPDVAFPDAIARPESIPDDRKPV